ncbi:MAG: hypothetical protein LBJ09_02220 [Clostridiales bacterium]|jgi:hypothetical protein|nr:hypothetical protein [Clostridiales bacterium]
MLQSWVKLFSDFSELYMNENGTHINKNFGIPKNEYFPSEIDSKIAKYGVKEIYKNLIIALKNQFENNQKKNWNKFFNFFKENEKTTNHYVKFFNYDWREDNTISSQNLYEEVKDFDHIIIVAHSNGALVACDVMKRLFKENQENKIELFFSIGAPYKGSAKTIENFEKGDSLPDEDFFNKINVLNLYGAYTKKFIKNCISCFELLPNKYYQGAFLQDKNGKNLSYDQSLSLLKNRQWNKKQDGTLKENFKISNNFIENMFINGEHVANIVNSYMFVGNNFQTLSKVKIDSKKNDNCERTEYEVGDETVTLNSAIPPGWNKPECIFYSDYTHRELVNDPKIINKIVDLIFEQE